MEFSFSLCSFADGFGNTRDLLFLLSQCKNDSWHYLLIPDITLLPNRQLAASSGPRVWTVKAKRGLDVPLLYLKQRCKGTTLLCIPLGCHPPLGGGFFAPASPDLVLTRSPQAWGFLLVLQEVMYMAEELKKQNKTNKKPQTSKKRK